MCRIVNFVSTRQNRHNLLLHQCEQSTGLLPTARRSLPGVADVHGQPFHWLFEATLYGYESVSLWVGFTGAKCTCFSVTPGCQQEFDSTETATCQCIEEARLDIKERVRRIKQVVVEAINNRDLRPTVGEGQTPISKCAQGIAAQL